MTHRAARFLFGAAALGGLAAASPATAEEISSRFTPPPLVESVTPTGYRVRVPIGPAAVERGRVYGFDLAEIEIPGGSTETLRGEPSLPTRIVLVRVPAAGMPVIRGERTGSLSLGVLLPTPIPRLVTEESVRRRTSPRALAEAFAGNGYRALTASTEAPAVARLTPMGARGERILAVAIQPVTWNPLSHEARVATEIVLHVSWERPEAPLTETEAAPASGVAGTSATLRGSLGSSTIVGPRYARAPRRVSNLRGTSIGSARAASGPLRIDPTRPWLRLGVIRPGLYRLTPADLSAAGVATTGIDPGTFRLYRANPGDLPESVDVDLAPDSLRECAIAVSGEGDGSFDPSDAIYFYATGLTGFGYDLRRGGSAEYEEAQRTDEEPLWLTWGTGPTADPPRRIASRPAAPGTPGAPLYTSVTHRVHFEENRFPAFDLFQAPLRWERWFMRLMSEGSRLAFHPALPGAVPGGATSIRVRMWGTGSSIGTGLPDHLVRVYWDRQLADTAAWNFTAPQDLAAAGLATRGARDTLEIEIPLLNDPDDPNRSDVQYLAWFEATYPRALAASSDTLQFAAPDSTPAGLAQYRISGIADTASAWLLDRSDPESPVRLAGGAWSGTASPFTWTVEDSVGPGYRLRYSLVSTAGAPRPPSISMYAPASSPHALTDLLDPANAADYLILTPPAFLAAAESLAVDRSSRLSGVPAPRAAIATTDRIFAQLGAGLRDPVAVRNALAYAVRRWAGPPLYVCLLGDASEDPKNYSGFAPIDWVPVYAEYWDATLLLQFISDDFYALLDGPGDQLFDVAIGRLPARDPSDALGFVRGKRVAFDRTEEFDFWRARSLLVADDAWKWSFADKLDPVGADHVRQMERKDTFHLPFPIRREKVYLNDYAFADSTHRFKPKAREAFIEAANAGNWLVDFIGHGNENVLADEQVFHASEAGRLTNAARPSIFGFFSCTVGKFDDATQDGLAELLLRLPNGGAAISLAASNEAFGFESTRLNDSFVDELFPAAPRADTLRAAGLAWARAKSASTSQNVVARKYIYLGDPALVPPLPRGRGVWEKGPLDSIPRGEIATIRGHALNPDGTPDTLSSGTVQLEALGPPSPRIQIGTSSGVQVATTYFLPGPLLYRGEVVLDRGSFQLRFVIPTDGRVVGRGAEIRALLSAAGGRGVGLAADSLRIAAALSPRVDLTPPTIRLRYPTGPDSTLAPGDRLTIELEDSSGIDLTRLDNAHSIFVIVDDRGNPIDLTSTFRYEPSSYTRGTVELTIPSLPGGAHLLEVHASDTYRNVAVARFMIDVAVRSGPNAALTLTEVFNYPNPFPRETFLHARLNRSARLRVQVLTVSGRRVRDFSVEGKVGENYIPWDGLDSRGEKVAIGVYLFKLTAEAPGGSRVTAVARALRAE